MTAKIRVGNVIIPGGMAQPSLHELRAVDLLAQTGKDVEFIRPSGTKNGKTPDVMMDGILWEIKCPTGSGRYTIQNQFRRAAKQSHNLILDVRGMKMHSKVIEEEVNKQFLLRRSIKKLWLITKSGKLIER